MTAIALARYVLADASRAGRWVPPVVLFLVLTVAGTSAGGTALGCYGFSATVLLPIALWLTVAVLNSEDRTQAGITVATVGSRLAVTLAKLAVAYLVCLALVGLAVLWPLLTDHPATTADVLAGVAGHLLTALAGVAFGSLLARPLFATPTWVVLAAVAITLAELLIPGFPPVRPIATWFVDGGPAGTRLAGNLLLIAVETVIGAVLLIGVGHSLAGRRA